MRTDQSAVAFGLSRWERKIKIAWAWPAETDGRLDLIAASWSPRLIHMREPRARRSQMLPLILSFDNCPAIWAHPKWRAAAHRGQKNRPLPPWATDNNGFRMHRDFFITKEKKQATPTKQVQITAKNIYWADFPVYAT